MGQTVMLKNVRGSFLNLFSPQASVQGGEPKFNGSFLLAKDDPQVALVETALKAEATVKWGAKAPAQYKALRAQDKVCLHDGDLKEYDGYADNLYVSASNRTRPTVIDRDHTPLAAEDGKPYSGCYVDVKLDIWAQDNQYGKRINAGLLGVMFRAHGDAFSGGSTAAPDDFDTLDTGEDEDAGSVW